MGVGEVHFMEIENNPLKHGCEVNLFVVATIIIHCTCNTQCLIQMYMVEKVYSLYVESYHWRRSKLGKMVIYGKDENMSERPSALKICHDV